MRGKTGIITLGGRFNYGNRLQNYATSVVWSSLGFEPTSLYLDDRFNLVKSTKAFIRKLIKKESLDPEASMEECRLAAFDRFNKLIPSRNLPSLKKGLSNEYNYFSVGSDQTWNPSQFAYNEDWFFLDFADENKRIALSPSIGLDSLSAKQAKAIARGVKHFPRISVREKRGAELIKECSGIDAEVICDPTLVLSAEDWRAIADGRCTPSGPYVFTYLLGGVGTEAADVLDKVTGHGSIPVVSLSDRQKPGESDAGPAEFVDLIDHASHVVTDSFHAAVFSSILHTSLTIVHREGGR